MKEYYIKKLYISLLIIIISLSLYSYILDCIISFKYTSQNFNFIFLYLIDYSIFHSWMFLIYCVFYYYLTRNIKLGDFIVFKITISLIIFYNIANIMAKDDYSIVTSDFKKTKIIMSYCLAILTMVLASEFSPYFKRNIN